MMVSRTRVFRDKGATHVRCLPSRPTTLGGVNSTLNSFQPLGQHFPEDPLLPFFPTISYPSNNEILVGQSTVTVFGGLHIGLADLFSSWMLRST